MFKPPARWASAFYVGAIVLFLCGLVATFAGPSWGEAAQWLFMSGVGLMVCGQQMVISELSKD